MATIINIPSGGGLVNNPAGGGARIENLTDPLPVVSNLFTAAHRNFYYQNWWLSLFYRWQEGRIQIPLAVKAATNPANPVACKIVRAHAPCGQLVAQFVTSRKGQWPLLPNPEPQSDNLKLADVMIQVATPKIDASGLAHEYAVSGAYTYFLVKPAWGPAVGLQAGWSPLDLTPFFFLNTNVFGKPLV